MVISKYKLGLCKDPSRLNDPSTHQTAVLCLSTLSLVEDMIHYPPPPIRFDDFLFGTYEP